MREMIAVQLYMTKKPPTSLLYLIQIQNAENFSLLAIGTT